MNAELKVNLIEIVRNYECIYNTKHNEYKNVSYKSLLWEKIGSALGIQGTKAKDIWRTLRDGYIRHRKAVKVGQTSSMSRKYSNYTWSTQMAFLDGFIELRSTGANTTQSEERVDPPEYLFLEPVISEPVTNNTEPSPPSPDPQQPTTSQTLPITKNDSDTVQDSTDKILDYLRNKHKTEWDDVDCLFMSYAKSFKKLPAWKQSRIKVEIAELFADAEFDGTENNANRPRISSPTSIGTDDTKYSEDIVDISGTSEHSDIPVSDEDEITEGSRAVIKIEPELSKGRPRQLMKRKITHLKARTPVKKKTKGQTDDVLDQDNEHTTEFVEIASSNVTDQSLTEPDEITDRARVPVKKEPGLPERSTLQNPRQLIRSKVAGKARCPLKKRVPQKLLEMRKTVYNPELNRKKDDCDLFGEYIASCLRKHDEYTRSMIKQGMNNILFEQDMKKFANSSKQPCYVNVQNPLEENDDIDDNDKII